MLAKFPAKQSGSAARGMLVRWIEKSLLDAKNQVAKPHLLPDIEFHFVATMGCGDACPFVRAKRREDWDIPDPKALPPEEFRAVRDLIGSKVKTLLETLE